MVILLAGGDKSTQASDIKTALPLSRNTYVLAYDFFSFVSRPLGGKEKAAACKPAVTSFASHLGNRLPGDIDEPFQFSPPDGQGGHEVDDVAKGT